MPEHDSTSDLTALVERAEVLRRDAALYEQPSRRNIERYVGTARVPVGLAGPLTIHGEHARGVFHVPMATTEGALVASTCRGMKVLTESGGVHVRVMRHGTIQRAPVFQLPDVGAAVRFAAALADWAFLIPVVAGETKHGTLDDVRCFVTGRHVHVRISLRPGDAAGQNMVSIAAAACVREIAARHEGIERVWMEGGFSGEKVASGLTSALGRGRGAVASASIPADVLTRITRARAADLPMFLQVNSNASLWGGSRNNHASLINILPALYIATGQDVASVGESSVAQNTVEYIERDGILKWEVACPNLVLGTVGGGTGLPTQRECLEILGCAGPGNADKLAEICAATALANEISFLSAICANEWVSAHAALRHRP